MKPRHHRLIKKQLLIVITLPHTLGAQIINFVTALHLCRPNQISIHFFNKNVDFAYLIPHWPPFDVSN